MKWFLAILIIIIPQTYIIMAMQDLFDRPIQIEVTVPSKIRLSL